MDSTLAAVAKRLLSYGHSIQECTELLYGHPGNQAWYTIRRNVRRLVDRKAVTARLREDGYSRTEIDAIIYGA